MKFHECQHVLADGNTCRAPRLRNSQFCYFHVSTRDRVLRQRRAAARKLPLQVPVLEDPWTVQLALGDILNAMLTDRIDHKKAALALYALQTASANMRNLGSRHHESYSEYVPELQASLPPRATRHRARPRHRRASRCTTQRAGVSRRSGAFARLPIRCAGSG